MLLDILVMSLWVGVDTPEIVTINLESQVSIACNLSMFEPVLAVLAAHIFFSPSSQSGHLEQAICIYSISPNLVLAYIPHPPT